MEGQWKFLEGGSQQQIFWKSEAKVQYLQGAVEGGVYW